MKLLAELETLDLPSQLQPPRVQGRVLIYDADSLCYRASATVKKLKTGVSRFQEGVLEQMFYTESESAEVHLTHKDCDKAGRGRIKGVKAYQANRTGTKRPELLHALRAEVCKPESSRPEYTTYLHMNVEADDACMISAYHLKDNGVLLSEDKDLRCTPYPFYDAYTGKIIKAEGIGHLWEHVTEAGNKSVHGIGRVFFWAQMLMGDTADNIGALQEYKGQRIGAMRTLEVLEPFFNSEDESEVANLVLDAYREIDQNPYPEGYLLHMMRAWGDSFHKLITELDITTKNKVFLEDCLTRDWFEKGN